MRRFVSLFADHNHRITINKCWCAEIRVIFCRRDECAGCGKESDAQTQFVAFENP